METCEHVCFFSVCIFTSCSSLQPQICIGNETVRKTEYSVCQERGTKKKSESPKGIEPMSSGTPVGRSI